MTEVFGSLFNNDVFLTALGIFFKLWPIWVPLLLLNVAFNGWMDYIRRRWINGQGSVLLEVKLPKEMLKTPAAMELVFNGLWEPSSPGTFVDAFWEGKVRDWFSFEIVSIGGEVKFFIWALPRWKKIIESRIYAQYPEAEVFEVEDYAKDLRYDPEELNMFGITTKLVKADAYPIKTYVEYELHKDNKEQEETIDPITPVLEYLGTRKPGEFAAMQILVQAHRKEGILDGKVFVKPDWGDGVKKAIKEILEKDAVVKAEKDKPQTFMSISSTQTDTIKAIERNVSKLAFDTMVRLLYIAPVDSYDKTIAMGFIGSMRQFGSTTLNGIRPDKFMSVAFPWQDFKDWKKREVQSTHIDAYKRRSFFNTPYKHLNGKPYILTTEELATIFHIPGSVASTPNLVRSPSKKSEAPANLPV
ncbi:MAG: hypothetical protein NUV78_01760 [Candidatus Zambryskibacteria bacterium]|nr:hypothetical protein [Candidatus Zambryskibacteria bacterium]